jgi:hypothetical protein
MRVVQEVHEVIQRTLCLHEKSVELNVEVLCGGQPKGLILAPVLGMAHRLRQ